MKALVLRQPGDAVVTQVPDPDDSGDQILLRVRLVGMCGSDLNSFRGHNPLVTFPRILGHEVAATVMSARKTDPRLTAGLNVTMSPYTACGRCAACRNRRANACELNQTMGVQRDGAMREFITMPAEKLYPSKLDLKELCLVEPLSVGFHAVARGRVAAGDTVAVLGCGGVGLGVIAGAQFAGARVIAVDVDDAKLALARSAGACETIHGGQENVRDRLRALTGGTGPEVVVEAIGTPETFRLAVEVVAFTGRVVYIGYAKQPVSYETKLFVQKELDIVGSRNALPEDFQRVIAMLEAGRFPVEDAISAVVPLEEAPEALRQWSARPSSFRKVMVSIE